MKISTNGFNFLKAREGLRLTAYNLGDKWTIGYGNTYYEDGTPVKKGDVITKARAESLFLSVVNEYAEEVTQLVGIAQLNQNQFDALVSYAYNRGSYRLANTELLNMVIRNPNDPKIREQFVIEWGTNTTYKTALINRRKLEAELYFSGSAGSSSNANLLGWGLALLGVGFLIKNKKS